MGPRPPHKIGKRMFKKRWPHSVSQLVRLHPFCHHQRSLKFLVHGDDFLVSGEPVDLVWMRHELESKLEIDTTTLGNEPGMSKEVKILNRKLCWHDGGGPETRRSNYPRNRSVHFDIIPMSKESKEDVRDKTDIVEKRKSGKLGMTEQPLIGQILSLAKTLSIQHWQQLTIFLPLTQETWCAVQKS